MSVELNDAYDRERLALYLAGLLPDNTAEAKAVLKLVGQLLPTLQKSREEQHHAENQREG